MSRVFWVRDSAVATQTALKANRKRSGHAISATTGLPAREACLNTTINFALCLGDRRAQGLDSQAGKGTSHVQGWDRQLSSS